MEHPWFRAGPVPRGVPATAVYEVPQLPHISRAESEYNFEQLKTNAGWCADADEPEEPPQVPPKSAREEMRELEQAEEDRDRIDRAVQQAIHPGSPISTLLKVGRQPLVKANVPAQPSGAALARQMSQLSLREKEQRAESRSVHRTHTSIELMSHYLSQALAHFDAEDDRPLVSSDLDGNVVTIPLPHVVQGEGDELRVKPDPPNVFVISWLDYSERYGLGYALCNGTVGVHFRDSTSMMLAPRHQSLDYVYHVRQRGASASTPRSDHLRRENVVVPPGAAEAQTPVASSAVAGSYEWLPRELVSKFKLMRFFQNEIMERLYGADSPLTYVDADLHAGMDFVHKWYRCKQAIVFRLSNGTVQFNFYDHTKLFLSQDGLVVSAIESVDNTDGVPVLRTWTLAELIAIAHPRRSAVEAASGAHASGDRDARFPDYFHTRPSERRFVRQLIKKLRYVRDVVSTTSTTSSR